MGFALFDRLPTRLDDHDALVERMWRRREFENYLLPARTLREYARQEGRASAAGPLFEESETERWGSAMDHAVAEHVPPVALRNPDDDYWMDTKLSEDLLARVFDAFFELGGPNQMRKADYHRLVRYIDPADVDPEVVSVLDSLASQARRAQPTGR